MSNFSCPSYYSSSLAFNLTLYVGSTFAVISLVENTIVLAALLSDRRRFSSYFTYLIVLASFDMLLCALYIPVIVIDQAKDRLHLPWLHDVWALYFAPALALCNVTMTASCYLIVAMQFERYVMTARLSSYAKILSQNRPTICVLAVAAAAVMKAPIYLELTVRSEATIR